jgi:hypothetical protein
MGEGKFLENVQIHARRENRWPRQLSKKNIKKANLQSTHASPPTLPTRPYTPP